MGKALLLGVLLAAGCGGTGSTGDGQVMETSRIVGNWIAPVGSCATYLDVTTSEFIIGEACVPASGPAQMSATKGTYVLSGTAFTTTNMESTCRDTPGAYGEKMTFSGDSLVMSDSTGAVVFVRNAAPAGSGAITFGCFSSGAFAAAPLAPL